MSNYSTRVAKYRINLKKKQQLYNMMYLIGLSVQLNVISKINSFVLGSHLLDSFKLIRDIINCILTEFDYLPLTIWESKETCALSSILI